MKTVIAAAIVAVGIVVLGFCIKAGLGSFLQNQRVVTVKGLAVREVKANKVIWPIVFKELGDDLPSLYNRVDAKNQIVKKFLRSYNRENEMCIFSKRNVHFLCFFSRFPSSFLMCF